MSTSRTAGGAVTFSGATTVAMGGSFSSDAIRVPTASAFAIQAVFAGGGSPTGTLKLQASNDEGKDDGTGITNWTDVGSSSQAITASGDHMWNVSGAAYRWVRIGYTRSSGNDTFSARLYVKGA